MWKKREGEKLFLKSFSTLWSKQRERGVERERGSTSHLCPSLFPSADKHTAEKGTIVGQERERDKDRTSLREAEREKSEYCKKRGQSSI